MNLPQILYETIIRSHQTGPFIALSAIDSVPKKGLRWYQAVDKGLQVLR